MISQWVEIQKKVKKKYAHFSSFNKLITSKLYDIISWADDSEENMVLRDTKALENQNCKRLQF